MSKHFRCERPLRRDDEEVLASDWQTKVVKREKLIIYAGVAELADAPDLGSGGNTVQVQVLSPAPNSRNPNLVPIGEGFGFLLYLDYPNFNSKLK